MALDGNTVPVYFKSIRKLVAAFGTVFNNVWLIRENADGSIAHKEKVALMFGPKQAWFQRAISKETKASDVDGKLEFGGRFPAMTYTYGNLQYDATRKIDMLQYHRRLIGDVKYKQLSPAPYNLDIKLSILSKNMEDGLMLLEQILPLFQPQLNIKINELPQMEIVNDVTIILNSVSHEDNYEAGFDENREISWDLDFTLRGNIYPPMVATPMAEKIIVELYDIDTSIKDEHGNSLDLDNVTPDLLDTREPVLHFELPEEP